MGLRQRDEEPVFGLDIGYDYIALAQIRAEKTEPRVLGYASVPVHPEAVLNGQIVDIDELVAAIELARTSQCVGELTTRHATASIPVTQTHTMIIDGDHDDYALQAAIRQAVEEDTPWGFEDVRIDIRQLYEQEVDGWIAKSRPQMAGEGPASLVVATPLELVESYHDLFDRCDLKLEALEPDITALLRMIGHGVHHGETMIVVNIDARNHDIALYDGAIQKVHSSETFGYMDLVDSVSKHRVITEARALRLLQREGIGSPKTHHEIFNAIESELHAFTDHIQEAVRSYTEMHQMDGPISRIALTGAGVQIAGLSDYIEQLCGIHVDVPNPWQRLKIQPLQAPHHREAYRFATAIGLALVEAED